MAIQKLIESFRVDASSIKKIPLTEDTKVIEKDGNKFKCRAAYELPVWRLDEKNLNERIYGKELAEKLIKEQPITLGLANHPKEDADVTYTFAVERNPHIKENIMYVDAYLIGENGTLANEIIEAGGSFGLSSSAYGDVDNDGKVKEDGFTIERYADWVDMPSYEVYAKGENSLDKNKENLDSNTNIIEKEKEAKNKMATNKLNENTPKTKSLEEKNLRLGVRNLFKEATSKDNLEEKLQVYKEVVDYCADSEFGNDYVQQAQEEISKIEKELYELADKGKELDKVKEDSEKTNKELKEKSESLESELTTLKEEYETATQLLDDMKTREHKIREMYEAALAEKNGMVTAEEYQEAVAYVESKEKELEEAQEENRKLKKRIKVMMERAADASKDVEEKKKKDDEDEDEEEEDSEENGSEEEKKDKKKEKVEESKEDDNYYNFTNNKQVKNYYEDLVYSNPNVEKIKEDILGCKTLFEAQMKYFKLRDLVEDGPDLSSYKRMRMFEKDEEIESKHRKADLNIREGWL